MKPAIVLLAHGSPDPDWRAPLERVVEAMRRRDPSVVVMLAFMDFIEPSLADAITNVSTQDITEIHVVAAFLSAGGRHLKRDVPALVETVAAQFPDLKITLVPGALGDDEGVIEALAAAALVRG